MTLSITETQPNDIMPIDTVHNDTHPKGRVCDNQHTEYNNPLVIFCIRLSVIMPNVIRLNVTLN
jgi:hypothetical protein